MIYLSRYLHGIEFRTMNKINVTVIMDHLIDGTMVSRRIIWHDKREFSFTLTVLTQ